MAFLLLVYLESKGFARLVFRDDPASGDGRLHDVPIGEPPNEPRRVMRPFFTVIVPTHCRAGLLERAIDSLRAQTFPDYEIIAVSDCTDRETYRVAAAKLSDSDVFIKRKGRAGPAESRNRGLEIASGEYVIFLDDDDTLAPTYLETLHLECEKNRGVVLYGNFQVIQENRDTVPPTLIGDQSCSLSSIPFSQMYVKNFIPNNVQAYPRMTLREKRFDLHLNVNEDWDFLLNVAQDSEFEYRDIYGARVHKDDPSKLTRRGGGKNDGYLIVDIIHIYRKWPGATEEVKRQRQQLLMPSGLQWPLEWL